MQGVRARSRFHTPLPHPVQAHFFFFYITQKLANRESQNFLTSPKIYLENVKQQEEEIMNFASVSPSRAKVQELVFLKN